MSDQFRLMFLNFSPILRLKCFLNVSYVNNVNHAISPLSNTVGVFFFSPDAIDPNKTQQVPMYEQKCFSLALFLKVALDFSWLAPHSPLKITHKSLRLPFWNSTRERGVTSLSFLPRNLYARMRVEPRRRSLLNWILWPQSELIE